MAEPRGKGKASRKRTFTSHSIDDILGTKEPDSQPRQTRAPTRSSPSIEEASSSDNSGQKNPKKKRITYTRQQKDALESYFHQVGYPDTEAREQIAQAVGIDQEKVQVSDSKFKSHDKKLLSCTFRFGFRTEEQNAARESCLYNASSGTTLLLTNMPK